MRCEEFGSVNRHDAQSFDLHAEFKGTVLADYPSQGVGDELWVHVVRLLIQCFGV